MLIEDTGAAALDTSVTPPLEGGDAPQPELSMEDSIRAKFRELTAPGKTDDAPAVDAPATGAARGPDGKFVAKKPEEGTPADEPLAPEAPVAETPEQKAQREAAAAATDPAKTTPSKYDKAPSSYRGETHVDWGKVPESIRAEIFRREEDMHKGLSSYKQMADIGKLFDNEFRPYEALIRSAGVSAPELVRNWLNTEYQLKTGTPEQKANLFATYAKQYGIDMQSMVDAYNVGPTAPAEPDPQVTELQKRVADMEAQRRKELEEAQTRERNEIEAEIEAFRKGHDKYDQVKLDMAALLSDGRAKTMQEAYDKACWADPTVRAELIAKQQEAERKQNAEKAAKAAQASATNVQKRGTPPPKPVVGTMDDTLRAKYREMTGTGS
jgi:hypothetical protein